MTTQARNTEVIPALPRKLLFRDTPKVRAAGSKLLDNTQLTIALPFPKTMFAREALAHANAFLADARNTEALVVAQALVEAIPEIMDLHLLLVSAQIKTERWPEALARLEALAKAAPGHIGVLALRAELYAALGRLKPALMDLRTVLKVRSDSLELRLLLAHCLARSGEREQGSAHYRQLLAKARSAQNLHIACECVFELAALGALNETEREWAEQEAKQLSSSASGSAGNSNNTESDIHTAIRASAAFGLARDARRSADAADSSADKEKYTQREIDWLQTANTAIQEFEIPRGLGWQPARIRQRNAQIKQLFSQPEALANASSAAALLTQEFAPIYICAMPRSGTTLLEQLLGASGELGQTGESSAVKVALDRVLYPPPHEGSYPEGVEQMSAEQWQTVGEYIIGYEQLICAQPRFVNKHLANPVYAGLLLALFPKARFVHLVRNPRDNAVSVYQNRLLNTPYSSSVAATLEAQGMLDELMQHWAKLYPERVYRLAYEALVQNPELELKALFSFLELSYTHKVLDFYQRKNIVATPSAQQVRQAINTGAVEKWRRYAALFESI